MSHSFSLKLNFWLLEGESLSSRGPRRGGRTLAGQGESWVRSCCNEALLFRKAENKMYLQGKGRF